MRKIAISLFALTLATAPVAGAQPLPPAVQNGTLTFVGDQSANGTIGNAKVGPYLATLSGYQAPLSSANAIIWCVDWDHVAPPAGAPDSYVASRIFGTGINLSQTRKNDLALYQKAAWLIEQYNTSALYTAGNIQGTLWQMFSPGALSVGASATDAYATMLTVPTSFTLTRDWFVLSDCPGGTGCVSNQEFMTSTPRSTVPEPSTYVLMASGLAALGALHRRRRGQA